MYPEDPPCGRAIPPEDPAVCGEVLASALCFPYTPAAERVPDVRAATVVIGVGRTTRRDHVGSCHRRSQLLHVRAGHGPGGNLPPMPLTCSAIFSPCDHSGETTGIIGVPSSARCTGCSSGATSITRGTMAGGGYRPIDDVVVKVQDLHISNEFQGLSSYLSDRIQAGVSVKF